MEKFFNNGLKKSAAYLHFEDGTTFKGFVNRESNDTELLSGIWGEAAFTTGMSGYQETITDPSFLGQHIIFTNAHIGNYAADDRIMQSQKTFATCLIARNFSHNHFFANIDLTKNNETIKLPVDTSCVVFWTISKDYNDVNQSPDINQTGLCTSTNIDMSKSTK